MKLLSIVSIISDDVELAEARDPGVSSVVKELSVVTGSSGIGLGVGGLVGR